MRPRKDQQTAINCTCFLELKNRIPAIRISVTNLHRCLDYVAFAFDCQFGLAHSSIWNVRGFGMYK